MLRRFQLHPSCATNFTFNSNNKFTSSSFIFTPQQNQQQLFSLVRFAGVGSSKAPKTSSATKKVDPKELPAPTWKDKIKKELMLILKLNLVLVPILVIGSLWWFPPTSPQKEKEMQELYKQSAGWKT